MNTDRSLAQQQGVTLIEVLVAILVLSFGLLGMLGLTANGIKMSSSSQYRTIAAQQLAAMADMINANPYIVSKYSPPTSTADATCLSSSGCAHTSTTTALTDTSYAKMPNNDYALWQANVVRLLPSGAGIICLDATPADGNSGTSTSLVDSCSGTGRPTIKICWKEMSRISTSGGGVDGDDTASSNLIDSTCISTQL